MIKSIVLFIIIVWITGFFTFNYQINNYKCDEEAKTDAIIVLTGGRNRISEASKLLNKGLSDKMFISGVQKGVSLSDISATNSIDIIDENKIYLGEALDTIGNAKETTQWIAKNHIKTIRLVTSNYHIPRALEEFKANDNNIIIVINPVYSDHVAPYFWKNWGTFLLLASEYNKFLYVYLRAHLTKCVEYIK